MGGFGSGGANRKSLEAHMAAGTYYGPRFGYMARSRFRPRWPVDSGPAAADPEQEARRAAREHEYLLRKQGRWDELVELLTRTI